MSQKRRVKIALVSDAVLPFHNGGKETRIDHLSKALVESGCDVHIYTMKWWSEPSITYSYAGMTYHAVCKFYPLYTGTRRSFKQGILFGMSCLKLVGEDYDMLEVDHMPYFPLFSAKLVSIIKRKPFYATWHEAVGLKTWQRYIGRIPGLIAYWLERLSVMMPDHIVVVSEHTQRLLRKELHYKGPLTLVANGIDYHTIEQAPPSPIKSDVTYAGRLVKHKNVDMLIQAIAQLKEKRPDIRAIIVGRGPEEQRLRALVKELHLEDNVVMTGRLQESTDVYSYMKSSKVFVSPSTREGFGITILEAYACGLEVVTVDHPDNAAQYLVRDGAGMVCDLSVEAIAESMYTLLTKEHHVRLDATQFDWSESAASLKELYGA